MTAIPKIVASFSTTITSSISSTDASCALTTVKDDAGNTLSGLYSAVIDEGTTNEEFVIGTLAGSTFTFANPGRGIDPSSSTTEVTALKKAHRRGASFKLTDYTVMATMRNIIDGSEAFPNDINLGIKKITSLATPVANTDAATKAYADAIAVAGAPNANTTTKGIVEEATTAEIDAGTATGSTGAELAVNPALLALSTYKTQLPTAGEKTALPGSDTTVAVGANNKYVTQTGLQNSVGQFASDTGSANAKAVTLAVIPVAYVTGMKVLFKNQTANTGATTINVNALGAKTIKKTDGTDLVGGELAAGTMAEVEYDGTNFQLISAPAKAVAVALTESGLVAGQSIAIGNWVTLLDDLNQHDADTVQNLGLSNSVARQAIRIIPRTTITSSSIEVMIKKVGAPVDDVTVEVQTDSGGNPSGTVITNGTSTAVNGSGMLLNYQRRGFGFASAFTLTADTTYWVVLKRSTGNDGGNYYGLGAVGGAYGSFLGRSFDSSNSTWTNTNAPMWLTIVRATGNPSLTVWKGDANKAPLASFFGFSQNAPSQGQSVNLLTVGIEANQSNLTPGAIYYTATNGALSTNTTTFSRFVGRAISATQLLVDQMRLQIQTGTTTNFMPGSATQNADISVNVGFRPRRIHLVFFENAQGGAGGISHGFFIADQNKQNSAWYTSTSTLTEYTGNSDGVSGSKIVMLFANTTNIGQGSVAATDCGFIFSYTRLSGSPNPAFIWTAEA